MAVDMNLRDSASGVSMGVSSGGFGKIIPETNATANPQNVGAVRFFSENDAAANLLASPETSEDFRLRVGLDSILDNEDFNYAAQNSSKHRYTTNTMTAVWGGGALTTNGTSILTAATGAQVATYRHFPVLGAAAIYSESMVAFTNTAPANVNIDFGLMLQAAAATTIPQDGVYFRYNSGGLFGILNNNGVEVPTSAFAFTPVVNRFYKFTTTGSEDSVQFWLDDVLIFNVPKPANNGSPFVSGSLPWGIRHHNTAAAGAAIQARVASYTVSHADMATQRLWASVMSGMGLSGVQGASGHTQGQTANYANSVAPVSATLSNTAAGYTTLGGQFQFAAVAGSEVDYALFAFQVPTPTPALTGRNLVIRGVWIDTINTGAAVATTPTLLQWALAVGATAVSLATAEAVNARAPRRLALGFQSFAIGDAIGRQAAVIDKNLDAPLVCEPGSFVHVLLKMPLGTATPSQIIRGVVGFNAYWE